MKENKTYTIQVFNVDLKRKDGDLVDSTQVDEINEEYAKELFYYEFGIEKREGDYLIFTETTEKISEEDYKNANLENKILEVK